MIKSSFDLSVVAQSASTQTIGIDPVYLRAKRVMDVILTLVFLFFSLPIFFIVMILIRIDSAGPIFYRQKRVGQNGTEFDMFKFRSMQHNSDDTIHREHIIKYQNGHTTQKLSNDSRITRIGRFIRKTSLDELPQLINVLRGEMTLVGPRPPLSYEVCKYSPYEWLRLCGRPGLTGIWQVYGRSQVTFHNMVSMDIEYLSHQSLLEDLKLIILTLPVMMRSRGGA